MGMPEPIAHWPLKGDARDAAGESHGSASNITYGEGPDGSGGAAVFNGADAFIDVADAPALRLGNADFSIGVWVKPEAPMTSIFGDVLSKFDPACRCGVNLHIAGSSPAYNGMSDTRHVHFGIDDGYAGAWQDHGKPWDSNAMVSVLIVFNGELYCGITDAADTMDAARVFRWAGGREWVNCGRLGSDPNHLSVVSMIVHGGKLYATAGVWDGHRAHGR